MAQTKAQVETITVAASEVRAHWSELVNRVANGEIRVIIEKNGASVAALVSPDDYDDVERGERIRIEGVRAMTAISEAFKDVPLEELEREITKAINEVRDENRARHSTEEQSSEQSGR